MSNVRGLKHRKKILFARVSVLKGFMLAAILLVGSCILGCGAVTSEEAVESSLENVSEEADKALEPIVKIVAGDMTGSGVLFDKTEEELIIVTAGHVLEQVYEAGAPVEVVFGDGYFLETASYVISESSEAAFISILSAEIPGKHLQRYEPVLYDKEKFDALAGGDEMVFKGVQTHDGQQDASLSNAEIEDKEQTTDFVRWGVGELEYSWIYVEDFGQYMMLINGESFPGMSGGGVFDSEGYYLGILCGVNDAGETAAVPLNVIMAEYMQLTGGTNR